MSFLTKTTPVLRTATANSLRPAPRLFSTTLIQQKSPTESVKDGLKTVDRTVADAAVKGIDKGVELKDKAASAAGVNAKKAAGEAQELKGEAQGKAAELKGKAKGAAEEAKAKM